MRGLFAVLLLAMSVDALACVDLPFTGNLDFDSAATYKCVDTKDGRAWSVMFDDQTVDLNSSNRNLVERDRSHVKIFNWFEYRIIKSSEQVVSHYVVNFLTGDSSDNTMYINNFGFLASNNGIWFQINRPEPNYLAGACYYNRVSLYGFSSTNQAAPSFAHHFEFSPDYRAMVYTKEAAEKGVTQRLNCTLEK